MELQVLPVMTFASCGAWHFFDRKYKYEATKHDDICQPEIFLLAKTLNC